MPLPHVQMGAKEFSKTVLQTLEERGTLNAPEGRIWGKQQQDDLDEIPEVRQSRQSELTILHPFSIIDRLPSLCREFVVAHHISLGHLVVVLAVKAFVRSLLPKSWTSR